MIKKDFHPSVSFSACSASSSQIAIRQFICILPPCAEAHVSFIFGSPGFSYMADRDRRRCPMPLIPEGILIFSGSFRSVQRGICSLVYLRDGIGCGTAGDADAAGHTDMIGII